MHVIMTLCLVFFGSRCMHFSRGPREIWSKKWKRQEEDQIITVQPCGGLDRTIPPSARIAGLDGKRNSHTRPHGEHDFGRRGEGRGKLSRREVLFLALFKIIKMNFHREVRWTRRSARGS
jgi:hypothetical protein